MCHFGIRIWDLCRRRQKPRTVSLFARPLAKRFRGVGGWVRVGVGVVDLSCCPRRPLAASQHLSAVAGSLASGASPLRYSVVVAGGGAPVPCLEPARGLLPGFAPAPTAYPRWAFGHQARPPLYPRVLGVVPRVLGGGPQGTRGVCIARSLGSAGDPPPPQPHHKAGHAVGRPVGITG